MSKNESANHEPLAIVGIGCRLPGGVSGPESFWQMMVEGKSGIVPVPSDRWNRERWHHENVDIPSKMITKWGGFVHDHDKFDAQFFGISPREALRMDPQQRWMLETAWESLEDAGMAPGSLRGSQTSVYVGIASNDYANVAQSDARNVDVHTNSGSTLSIASNRISYLFDLKGPSVSVDTACSSALVAINLACESIWGGSATMALAGGVNALLTPDASIGFSKATMLSPTGQCFAFDDRANGYVRGEGAGMFVIKPLAKAQEDGDRIYCTIKAAVINQDGNTSSMTVPGVETQAEMLRIAYAQAGIEPKRVRYMEAHGTGTPVGDPIETRALGIVLSDGRDDDDVCMVGSVKTNVGHLESGSGVAGVAKAALVLHHDTIPPNLNFKNPNPNIPFDEFKMKVVTELQPLPHLGDYPPVVGVNSFGFGGTNSHIVLEAAPPVKKASSSTSDEKKAKRPVLLPVSARGDDALTDTVKKWRRYLKGTKNNLSAIAAAAGLNREHHDNRLAIIADDKTDLLHEMTEWLATGSSDKVISGKPAGEAHPLVFVFTGQGAQWWKMGQELIDREPVFRGVLEEIDKHLKPLAGWSLIDEMKKNEESSQINRTNIAQPAIFGLQIALAELWKSWGIVPSKVVGHSVGEVAAAYVAGAYTMEDAVTIIYHRSRLQDNTGGNGRMVAVGISQAEAKKVLAGVEDEVQVAVVNSPGMLTLAGNTEPLEAVVEKLEEEGKFVRWLRIDYAFHTHQMEPIKDELLETLKGIKPRETTIPYISTVTGGMCEGTKLNGEYWWKNVRESVLFAPAIANLIRSGEDTFLELGPHPALQNPILECLSDQGRKGFYFSSLKRKTDESVEMLTQLASLHNHGYKVDWESVNQSNGADVRLPTYAWQKEKFWLESPENEYLRCAPLEHPLLGLVQTAPKPTWRFDLDPRYFTWLDDHRFWDSVVFPAAGYGEIGIAISRKLFPDENYVVEDLEMKKALFITEEKVPAVQVVFDPDTRIFQIFSSTGDQKDWELNSQGVLRKQPLPVDKVADFDAIKADMEKHFTHEEYYEDYEDAGYQFRPLFQHLQNVWRKDGEALAEIVAPEGLRDTIPDHHFHPAVLDACFHTVKGGQVIPDGAKGSDYFYLPAAIRSIRLYTDKPPLRLWGHAKVNSNNDREYIIADIDVYDDAGNLVAEIYGFRADRVEQNDNDDLEKCLYEARWERAMLKGARIEGSAEMPSPGELVAAAGEGLQKLYDARGLADHYGTFLPAMEAISRQFITNAYIELGWDPEVGDTVKVDAHMADLSIADQHRKLVYGQMTALTEAGVLKAAGDGTWKVVEKPEHEEALQWVDKLAVEMPEFASEAQLQRLTGPNLAGVLCGETDPLEVLFPGGSASVMERFYREGADFPVINQQIRLALAAAVKDLPERRAIRVLEVGAGTGSLTNEILGVFPPERTEYVFTDNGPLFLQSAQDRFEEEYPFVEYKMFDCEKSPESQGFEPHHFDIILASNVIHATQDLTVTMNNLRRCMAPDATLMFLEVTWRRAALDNVFGLLGGWWRFTDTDLREHSALLTRKEWATFLGNLDFREVTSFISSPIQTEDQQACLVAKAPSPVEMPEVDEEADSSAPASEEGEVIVKDVVLITDDASGLGKKVSTEFASDDLEMQIVDGTVAAITAALDLLDEQERSVKMIIQTLALDHPRAAELDLASLSDAQDTGVHFALGLVPAIVNREWETRPQVVFLTRGTMPVNPGESLPGLASAPITGLLRVVNNEHPEYCWTQIDLDPADNQFEIKDLCDEITLSDKEHEIAFRGNGRFVRRVHRVKPDDLPARTRNAVQADGTVLPYRLQIDKPGILTNLSLNETSPREPDPDEIEIQIKAGGINFRDVMKALGIYPGNPVDLKWFGDDFSGTVVKVGSNVKDLAVGDNVVGMAPYCFRSYVTVHRNMVFRKPDTMSHVEAATLPTVFLTTHYAMNELAHMEKGESILIHAGTGGVGQAAIQIAQHLGLVVFSTAGSPEKRQLLTDMGVDHVLDSRTLKFADEIMRITNGEGVDAVLNSLAGDFIPKNFSVLKTFGRYMEIGKVDVYGNSKIGLEPLRNNISFFVIDLAQHLQSKPAYVAKMFSELEVMFYEETYKPLPNKSFPVTEVVEAFRYMAAGKHIGKNVLDFDLPEIEIGQPTEDGNRFRGDGTFLITGGAGGFGLELAQWMADNGARHFALMSRSGPKDDVLEKIAALKASGATIMDARGDVTKRADIDRIVKEVQAGDAPLIGVIHGAMVLDDEFVLELNKERFDSVLLPKMLGAWNLHEATLDIPLDSFICFSSFSAFIGAVKQSNYNAGNVFLDQLSYHRRSLGLPSLTFNWGALEGAGFVSRNEKTQQYLELVGLGATNMEETLHLFSLGAPSDCYQLGAARCNWQALGRFSPSVGGSKMFLPVVPRSSSGGGDSMSARILEAPVEKRAGLVEDLIAAQVGAVLGTDASRLDKDTPLTNLGLDSLMAIELVNRIEEKLGMSMPMGSVLNGPSIKDLSIPVLEKLIESGGAASSDGSGLDASSLVEFEVTGEMPEMFPLTEGQKALWFLNRLAPNSSAYNLNFSGKFRPLLDIDAMKKAFSLLFERHPLIDVTFTTVNGEPMQVVHTGRTIDFREHDCTALDDEQLKALISEHAGRPFNLERGPVVRLELFRTADDAHVALLSMHHIISDAWSIAVMIQDLIEYYFSTKAGRTPQVEPIAASYSDFVNWEKAHLESEAGENMFEFWKEHLAGAPAAIDLPTDRTRPAVQTFNGATYGFQLDETLTDSVNTLAQENSVTLFTTLLSAYDILMHRYCQQDDIVIGVPLAGRTQPELKSSVGYFINPVPVRSTVEDDPTVADYLASNSLAVNGALENQQYPLARMVDRLDVVRDPGRSPLFQVSFTMEKVPGIDDEGIAVFLIGQGGHTFHVGDLSMETIDLTTRQSQFEITLTLEEAGGQLFGCWQYNSDLFDEATIKELNGLYEQVLRQITADSSTRVSEVKLLDADDEKTLVSTLNDTKAKFEDDALLHNLIAAVAAEKDEDVAVVFEDNHTTYGKLNRLANGVARDLIADGVGVGDNVGVLADRSPRMIGALLGVLKAGATYVPLDPDFPAQRLDLMLEDAAPKALIASGKHFSEAPAGGWKSINLDSIEGTSKAPDVKGVTADSLAYIIYTSGSTGTPKGVEIPHRAAVNFLRSMEKAPGLDKDDTLLAVTTLSFDISLLELFLPLLAGAKVVMASGDDVKDGRRLANLLSEEDITVMQATPATWQLLLDSGWEGKSDLRIFCGGEALTRGLANTLVNSAAEVWNLYGPTETTVWSSIEKIKEGDETISIGLPIANTQVYILDGNNKLVPQGFTGELWIGGSGLARGYRNQLDLTAEAFREIDIPGAGKQRLYRTGDLARWNRDNKLECLGRVDFQVKVRGVRMELGDIEQQMESIDGIKQAVVAKREDLPTGEGLVGYFISDNSSFDVATIRENLAVNLPASYIPAFFKRVEEFPLTPNRKIDRRRLPMPTIGASSDGETVAPRTSAEEHLWKVFSRNFDSEDFGVTDNFFEMGGDSLMALRIIVDVSDEFGQDVPVDVFLTHPNIEQLSQYLSSERIEAATAAVVDSEDDSELIPSFEDFAHISIEDTVEEMPKLDAVALAYIPDVLVSLSGMTRDEISERLFAGKPRLTNVYELDEGKIGVLMLPCFETDFYKNLDSVKAPTIAALEMAAEAGAKCVSLTGVIPMTTDHGRKISEWIAGLKDLPEITTGDATRSATIVKSVEGILAKTGRDLSNETLSAVGLGSIGFGTLLLMLDVMEHPKRLILCDPYQTDDQMSRCRDLVRDAGYQGQVDIVKNGGALPPEVYEASIVVASSNLPGVLDIKALKPGALIVDYSFPPVFRVDEAIRRFTVEHDILFTTGGELRMSNVVNETIYLPDEAEDVDESVQDAFTKFLAGRDKNEITGCVLVSLLTGSNDDLSSTLGPLEHKEAVAHYEALEEMEVTPAKLQMAGFFLPEAGIDSFLSNEKDASTAT
ncbi:amino acid adenylation domain-containing protein [Verrucomicrobiales bacterium]|nr:amino acid adenylation domain-containing protein [Verrucomicrobiales bacterium]